MKPYYEHAGIAIYHGDCRDILPSLPAIGLLLADPPYGIALKNNDTRLSAGRWRDNKIVGDDTDEIGEFLTQFAFDRGLPTILFANPMRPWSGAWRQYLVWDKGGAVGGGGDTATCWKQTWELIQVSRTPQLSGGREEAVLRFPIRVDNMTLHPAQKPVSLLSYLISKVGSVADPIVDPTCGVGSTILAAKNLGRQAIGIEVEEKYCEIAAKRLSQEVFDFA
jgi:hypothetical protein